VDALQCVPFRSKAFPFGGGVLRSVDTDSAIESFFAVGAFCILSALLAGLLNSCVSKKELIKRCAAHCYPGTIYTARPCVCDREKVKKILEPRGI
jgi:hypothetical protein